MSGHCNILYSGNISRGTNIHAFRGQKNPRKYYPRIVDNMRADSALKGQRGQR